MDSAGFEKDAVADRRLELVKTSITGSGRQLPLERTAINAALETSVDFAAWLSREDDPGFGLAEIGRREERTLFVIGMNLDGEGLVGVEEFEEERKLGLRVMAAKELGAVLGHYFVERFAGEWTGFDDALIGAVVDDFPTFGVVVGGADRFRKQCAQAAAAPEVLLQNRVEAEWFVEHLEHLA
jgi:hypothetical protein